MPRTKVWIKQGQRDRLAARFGKDANLSGMIAAGLELLLQLVEPPEGGAAEVVEALGSAMLRASVEASRAQADEAAIDGGRS